MRSSFVRHAWDAYAACFRPDLVVTDTRRGLRATSTGRDAIVRGLREAYDDRRYDADWEIVASRGRAGVVTHFFHGPGDERGPWESERLFVYQLDPADDVIARYHYLDPDDRAGAYALLDRWAPDAGGADPGCDPVHVDVWRRYGEALSGKDWPGHTALAASDAVYIDRRSGLRSEVVGGAEITRVLRESFGTRDFVYTVDVLATRGRFGITLNSHVGLADDHGGPWETQRLVVYELAAGQIKRAELFEPNDRDAAFARLRELAGGGVRAAPGVDERFVRLCSSMQPPFASKDWDAWASHWEDDAVLVDHRLRSKIVGRSDITRAQIESFGTREGLDYDLEIFASNGNACASSNCIFGPADDQGGSFEAPRLMLSVFDDHDLYIRCELFEPTDREGVMAALAKYGGERSGVHAAADTDREILCRLQRFQSAVVSKDWETAGLQWTADAVYADRRPGLRSELVGGAEVARVLGESYGRRDVDYRIDLLATKGSFGVIKSSFSGPGDDVGGPWETSRFAVIELDDEWTISRGELFDDEDAVYARFRELAGGGVRSTARADERHVTAWQRFRASLAGNDWDAFGAVLDADVVHADHRAGLRSEVAGVDAYVDALRSSWGTRDFDYDVEILGTQGGAGVMRGWFFGPGDDAGGPFEAERVAFYELNAAGRFVRFDLFDPDDRARAFALMDAKATSPVRSSVPGAERFVSVMERARSAHVRRDWNAIREQMDERFVFTDHRAGLRSVSGPDEYVDAWRESFGARELHADMEIIAVRGTACAVTIRWFGPADGVGGPWETNRVAVVAVADDDRIVGVDIFEPERLDDAFARLRGYGGGGVRVAAGVDERFARRIAPFRSALVAKDWEGVRAHFRDDFVFADRRPGLRAEGSLDDFITSTMESYAQRDFDVDFEIFAAVGDACVLRAHWFGPGDDVGGPWATDRFALVVLDETGLQQRVDLFEAGEAVDAIAILEQYVADTAPRSQVRLVVERFVAAYNDRDWARLEALIAPGFVHDDHRPLGWGAASGPDALLEPMRIGLEETPDARISAEWIGDRGDVGVFSMPMRGHTKGGGGDFQLDRLMIAVADGERLVRLEAFGPDQAAIAETRFDELAGRS
jgi:ketosteroid isomerase-like protein